jgi:hypothetical protein
MQAAIIAGVPPDADRQIHAALSKGLGSISASWSLTWIRSKGPAPGLSPSQIQVVTEAAARAGGAHLIVIRNRDGREEQVIKAELTPYFRFRWLEHSLLKLIPHSFDKLFESINATLDEELKWAETVKPGDESCCLLLPECAFSPEAHAKHIWTAASESGSERIALAARAVQRFGTAHWLSGKKDGSRAWIDTYSRVFDHRGPRHGTPPFPRGWKFSFQVVNGFHYDVTSRDSRKFHVLAIDGTSHNRKGTEHVNIDPHGYVRA